MLRVIAGTHKGYKLLAPDSAITRPTKDIVRESVFSMIQFELENSVVLDLFAGSGSIGIEALSREANFCDFVDSNKNAIDIIKKNIEKTGFSRISNIYMTDYRIFLMTTKKKYDIIFLDPPYDFNFINELLDIIIRRDLVNIGGIVVHEGNNKNTFINVYDQNFAVYKGKRYGITRVIILKRL